MNLVEESEQESALMILCDSEFSERLLQGNGEDVNYDLWYPDIGGSSHMTGIKSFFHSIHKHKTGNVKFGDGSSIKYEGRGTIIVMCKNGEEIEIKGVLYLPKLKTNILSLGKLDDQGCKMSLSEGYLTTRDKKGKLLTKTKKTRGNMYQIKLSISEACNLTRQHEVWRSAMVEELSTIENNKMWTLVKAPRGIKPIRVKWVYRLKRDQTGAVVKHKAQLLAKGYSQQFRIDYEEIYAPVARFDSIRILIAIAAQLNWSLHHLDVKSAFLNGMIKEDIYVMQPEGYVKKGKESFVLKLTKALYGQKQAPLVWNSKLNKTISDLGFNRSRLDTALYHKGSEKEKLIVGIYVDDLIITGSSEEQINKFKAEMMGTFEMTDLGLLNSYLGMEIRQSTDIIFLSQRAYLNHILKVFKMNDCNAIKTPMEVHLKLQRETEGKQVNSTNFRSLIGSLWYLMNTRTGLTYSVSYLTRFIDKPSSEHLPVARRILRYLKGTMNYGLLYNRGDRDMKIT